MDLSTLANLINTFAVSAGVIFAATQIRYYRQRRRRDAMVELVRSFQNPSFTSAFRRVLTLPDDATTQQIREKLGPDGEETVYLVTLTWESLGVMLFRGEVTIDLIDDFFSGPILISWRKLNVFVEEDRRALDRNTVSEWFQWLAERMIEREKSTPAVPAHIAHREWK
jgi:superfamily I DNA/RNA helicase